MAESLAEFFLVNFKAHGDERAYGQHRGYRMEWFTYGQIVEMAFRFCRELEERGIAKGDRVMLWGENCAQWVATFFGCAMCGVVVVPMDDGASDDFAARVADQVGAKLWICSRKHSAEHASAAGSVPVLSFEEVKQPIPSTGSGQALPLQTQGQGQAWGTRREPDVAVNRDDTLQVVFTSGTTAEPKGVVITHGNVLANIDPLQKEMQPYLKYERWVHPVRFLNLLPLSHVFGQFLTMFLPPLLGGTVIFQEEMKPSEIMNTIRRERVSVLVTVPRVLQSLKQKIERDLENSGRLEDFLRSFRAAEDFHFLRRWWTFRDVHRQFGWKFWAFICGGVAAGYWQGNRRTDVSSEQGWYRTGDVGALDSAGNLYFKGRKKEVMVTPAGLNIYPEDLEAALRRQPEVKDCVVVGIERGGNAEPCAVVIMRGDAEVEEVLNRANEGLAEFQRMRMWVRWPQEDFPARARKNPAAK